MRSLIVAHRYARALHSLASETKEQDIVFEQMRIFSEAFTKDEGIAEFLQTPLVSPEDKRKAMAGLLAKIAVCEPLKNFLLVLAKKNRLGLFSEMVFAYQTIADEANGVTRGTVRSATVLGPEDRRRLEELVGRATKKQVILSYKEDSELLGGLVAQVGSYTFDDSLDSHLNRINEQLTRSTH
jgi:F-type H+-transporting ATPase subunit delta